MVYKMKKNYTKPSSPHTHVIYLFTNPIKNIRNCNDMKGNLLNSISRNYEILIHNFNGHLESLLCHFVSNY